MNYNKRIDDNFLKADHTDGEVLQHTDLNELESVVKTAINANYTDIQKMQDGSIPVSSASSLKGIDGDATLSQYITETLQPNDNTVPTSLQVKNFVDSMLSNTNTGLIFYWNGTNGADSAEIFNKICNKYDKGEKFVFYGLCNIDTGYYNASGEYVNEPRNLITPIMVSKMDDLTSDDGIDTNSFTIPPCFTSSKYCVGGIKLTGTWGNYTNVEALSWADSMAPVTKQYVDSLPSSTPIIFAPTYSLDVYSSDVKSDGRIPINLNANFNNITENLLNEIGSVNTQVIYNLTINNLPLTFIGVVTSLEKTDTVHKATIELTSLGIKNDILDKTKYAHYKATHSPHWETNTAGNFLRISNFIVLTKVQI